VNEPEKRLTLMGKLLGMVEIMVMKAGMEKMKKSPQLTFMILILILLQENTIIITWPALHSTCDYS
jgi:hypothetical protein